MVKNLPVSAGDMGLIPGLGRSPGEGNGNPSSVFFFFFFFLQYFCLGIPWTEESGGLQSMES